MARALALNPILIAAITASGLIVSRLLRLNAHAVEMSREGIPLLVIQRQLGHADLAVTSTYLRGIDWAAC